MNHRKTGTDPIFRYGAVPGVAGVETLEAHDLRLHYDRHFPERVRERIDAQCCEPLRLRDLCALAALSPTRLLRSFSAAYGLTPHRYQQARRMAKARRLIAARMPLAEVAAACGYADQGHLNRWFLRARTTPGRYRRNFLQDGSLARE